MSIIKEVKELHKTARLAREKDKAQALTMLISRADADRVKYGLQSSDELSDEQMIKIIQAEVKQIEQELEYLSGDKKLDAFINISMLKSFLPEEMSRELIEALIDNILIDESKRNMKDLISGVKAMGADLYPEYTIPMGLVSQIVKSYLK